MTLWHRLTAWLAARRARMRARRTRTWLRVERAKSDANSSFWKVDNGRDSAERHWQIVGTGRRS